MYIIKIAKRSYFTENVCHHLKFKFHGGGCFKFDTTMISSQIEVKLTVINWMQLWKISVLMSYYLLLDWNLVKFLSFWFHFVPNWKSHLRRFCKRQNPGYILNCVTMTTLHIIGMINVIFEWDTCHFTWLMDHLAN